MCLIDNLVRVQLYFLYVQLMIISAVSRNSIYTHTLLIILSNILLNVLFTFMENKTQKNIQNTQNTQTTQNLNDITMITLFITVNFYGVMGIYYKKCN